MLQIITLNPSRAMVNSRTNLHTEQINSERRSKNKTSLKDIIKAKCDTTKNWRF